MKKLTVFLFITILLAACQSAVNFETTTNPPIETPNFTPTSSPVEVLASSINDLVGVWWFPKVGMIEFKVDGTSRISLKGETIAEGNFTFDNGKVTWATRGGCEPATYEAYVAKQDGKPIWLRMQVVGDDPCTDRANAFSSKGKFQNP